jgi:ATP-binding cassette subfamily C (CFTR/MRP) protein 2
VLGFVFTYLATLRKGILKQSDRRVKLMNEILSGIKIIKLYCWDLAFADKVQDVRIDEVKLLAKLAYLVGIAFSVILLSLPLMLPVIVFSASATLTGVTITASKAFTVISLFNILRFPFAFLPLAIVQWIVTGIALGRVQNFLLLDELDTEKSRGNKSNMKDSNANAIEIHGPISFSWDRSPPERPIRMDKTTGKRKSKKQYKEEVSSFLFIVVRYFIV